MPDVRSKIVGIIRFDDRGYASDPDSAWSDSQLSATLSRLLTDENAVGDSLETPTGDHISSGDRNNSGCGQNRCQPSRLSISQESMMPADVASIYGELCELLAVHQP